MSYTFDGATKRITLGTGVTTLNLSDLYSRWKDWVLDDHAEFAPAFHAVGGDIPAIPLYLFIDNGWRIVPQSANHTLTVVGGVLEVDGGGDPFVDPPSGSYRIRINREAPGIAIGYSTTGGTTTGPSAEDLAAAVGQRVVEGDVTIEQVLRLLLAYAAGDAAGLDGPATVFKSLDGTKTRIGGTISGGNRVVDVRDGT